MRLSWLVLWVSVPTPHCGDVASGFWLTPLLLSREDALPVSSLTRPESRDVLSTFTVVLLLESEEVEGFQGRPRGVSSPLAGCRTPAEPLGKQSPNTVSWLRGVVGIVPMLGALR